MSRQTQIILFVCCAGITLALSACQPYRNFTTYYNRFWNMERIMAEVEDEVEYARAQKDGPKPNYYLPYDEVTATTEVYSDFLNRRTLDPDEVRANKIKLDSVWMKGSLLLERDSESDYVDDALYYISKAYFYEREWYQSQKKAEELIATYPNSKWMPDVHLVYAMDLMRQGKLKEAEDMLSKTVDVAFRFKRSDVLTDAFRLNADIQLAQGRPVDAVKPYERAILLSDDEEEQARWQYEIGVVQFRAGRFNEAVAAFDKVTEYDPTDLVAFEAELQRAVSLRAAERYDDAEASLNRISEEERYKPWLAIAEVERVSLAADRTRALVLTSNPDPAGDSALSGEYAIYGLYERGLRAFKAGDYLTAYQNFAAVQSSRTPFNTRARSYTTWISFYRDEMDKGSGATRIKLLPFPDSLGLIASRAYYNVARFFVRYDLPDSIKLYYQKSFEWAPTGSVEGARALYALSDFERHQGYGVAADSILRLLAENYGDNDYANYARYQLGYSERYVVDDVRDQYESARNAMLMAGEYRRAIELFRPIYMNSSGSQYAPQSLYATGLIFEKYLDNPDSALYYYGRLLNTYPESEQARSVRAVVEFATTSGGRRDTTGNSGLVALGEENRPSRDTTAADANNNGNVATPPQPTTPPWFDSRLYDPVPQLALERREKRTSDLE